MLEKMQYLPVNWIDGMKISKDHFIETENAVIDRIRDNQAQLLRLDNYGLLLPEPGKNQSLEYVVNAQQINDVRITLHTCRAVTRAGVRIEILKESNSQTAGGLELGLQYDFSNAANQDYYILLGINPFKRMPVGMPRVDETPPRHPFAQSSYYLDVRAADEINREEFGAYQMPLGKIQLRGGQIKIEDTFIPPCTAIGASPTLMSVFGNYMDQFFSIQKYAIEVMRKIKRKKITSTLTDNLYFLSDKVTFNIAELMHDFQLHNKHLPPIEFVGVIQKLARLIGTTIKCIPENEREQMLNYFREWTRISSGDITHSLQFTSSFQYTHFDVNGNLENAKSFLDLIQNIFHKISEQDYIDEGVRQVAPPPPPQPTPQPTPVQKTSGIVVKNKETGETVINKYWNIDE